MAAIIKNNLRIRALNQFRQQVNELPTYFFLSGQEPWEDENNPPIPVDASDTSNQALSDVLALKRVSANDMVAVVPRTNWASGTIYDHYSQDVDLINSRNPVTGDFYRFYVLTEDFNVYKCLSNYYSAPSTFRPTGTNPEAFRTPDGYTWKYMYTIQAPDAFQFMTSNWMPCYTLTSNDGSSQWNSQQSAVPGTIDNIIITSSGVGYSDITLPTITITGDGSGAEAVAEVNFQTGEITDIIVTNPGMGYTQATITINDSEGSGSSAQAVATIGPRHGHGANPMEELGANYLMIKTTIDGSEGGVFPTSVTYRKTGLIQLPLDVNSPGLAVSLPQGNAKTYAQGETITGSTSNATGEIVLVDYTNDILYINNIVGQFLQSETISSQSYNQTGIDTIFSSNSPLVAQLHPYSDVKENTGELLYIANREFISRVDNQKEDIIAIVSF